MSRKSLIILLVLVVVVAGAVGGTLIFLGQQSGNEQAQETAAPTPTPNVNLSEAAGDTITNIVLKEGESEITLTLEDGIWVMAGSSAPVDQVTAGSIATYLTYLYAHETINIGDTPLGAYGLDPGDFTATYTTSGGTFTNYYGKYTSTRDAVYFRRDGDSSVYTVETEYFDGVKNDLSSLRDRSVNIPEAASTGYIAIGQPGEAEIVIKQVTESDTYSAVPWMMTAPMTIPVTEDTARVIQGVFSAVTLTGFVGEDVKEEYGIDGQTYIEYRDFSGEALVRINIGALAETDESDAQDAFYCAASGKEGVYLLPRSSVDAAAVSAFTMIDQRMIPLDDMSELDQMTIIRDDQTVILTQKDTGFSLGGEEISQGDADALLNKMRTVNFVGLVDGKVSPREYCSIRVARAGFGGKDIDMKVYLYLKDFYAVDYGSGTQVYVKAELLDNMLDAFMPPA